MPDNWGGYECEPTSIEFWQGRPSRLHDRIRYTKLNLHNKSSQLIPEINTGNSISWIRERLSP
jgi:pyridoxamine 5'-phosphate oxidase